MPLGGVIAFKGIENAMVSRPRLAGLQHLHASHHASSTSTSRWTSPPPRLNEKQTIYGGEANLKKALDNVLRVYAAEGDRGPDHLPCGDHGRGPRPDRQRITCSEQDLTGCRHHPGPDPELQREPHRGVLGRDEGDHRPLCPKPTEKHQRINVIIPHISPADIREIKRILALMGMEYTLLPDYSLTLDRPYGGRYQKIPPGGTRTEDIAAHARRPAHDPVRR